MRRSCKRRRFGPEPGPAEAPASEEPVVCPLCERPIPPGAKQSQHHLVPKLKGGRHGPTVRVHQICHNEVHATLSEAELARDYATIEALKAHPRLAKFFAWVAKKPPSFHARSMASVRRANRR